MPTGPTKKDGFALPTILIASVVMLTVLLSAVGAAASIRTAIDSQYYNQLGREAVESGLELATECLKLDTTPNWTDVAPLRPGSGCVGSVAENGYVLDTAAVKTSFTVGAYSTDVNGRTSVTAKASVSLRRLSAPTQTWRTYEQTTKRIVQIIPLFTALSGNDSHTCALASSQVFCWGANTWGQLGNGTTASSLYPQGIKYVNGLMPGSITDVGTGNLHTCVLSQQKVWCWGHGGHGQLGNGTSFADANFGPSSLPTPVGGILVGKTVTHLAVGANNTCVVASSRAYCWGYNPDGQVGDGTTANKLVPTAVNTTSSGNPMLNKNIIDIASTDYHSCAAISGGTAACWGRNTSGELGNNTLVNSAVPVSVVAGGVTEIQTGSYHTCVIASNRVWCWGYNSYGQLGYGDLATRMQHGGAVAGAMGTNPVTALSVGDYHTCAVSLGLAYCWGRSDDGLGQIGDRFTINRTLPVAVYTGNYLNGKTITGIFASDFHTCATTNTKAAYCWGRNSYGQLGDNTTFNHLQAVPVYTANFKPVYTDF